MTQVTCDPASIPDEAALLLDLLRGFPDRASVPARLRESLDRGDQVDELVKRLVDLRLLHLLAPLARRSPALRENRTFAGCQQMIAAMATTHLAELAALTEVLTAQGVPTLVMKGLAVSTVAYADLPFAFSGDVDLLVRREDQGIVHEALQRLGFREGLVVRESTPARLSADQLSAHERSLWLFGQSPARTKLVRAEQLDHLADLARAAFPYHVVVTSHHEVYLRPSFDVHYSLNTLTDGTPRDGRPQPVDWWGDPRTVERGPARFQIPNPGVLAWFLPYHAYLDLKLYRQSIWKLIADIVALCRAGLVDTRCLVDFAGRRPAVGPAVHWIYRFLGGALGVNGLTELVDATSFRRPPPATDFGDVIPDLLGIEPRYRLQEEPDA